MSSLIRSVASKTAFATVLVVLFSACSPPTVISVTQKEYMECFRLDREPFDGELDARCTDQSARLPKTGTFHRDSIRELKADILPMSMDKRHTAKLPVSDCLWVGSSGSGAGDRLVPLWEATVDLDFDSNGTVDWHVTSCRLDPPYPRVSLNDPNVQRACLSAERYINFPEPVRVGDVKSTCDTATQGAPILVNLALQQPEPSAYGECGDYNSLRLPVPNFVSPTDLCALVNVLGDGQVTFGNTLLPREDGLYVVDADVDKALSPGIRTVMGVRSIARPLMLNSNVASWQTPLVVEGPPAQQRWHENFTDAVRVERVRVFSVTNSATDDREYVSLDGALLTLTDPDGTTGAGGLCTGEDDSVDLLSCQIDVTPTYRPANLARLNLPVLTAPLTWSIDSDQIEENGREYYIEFDLVSTYRSRQAALLAEIPNVEFGGITLDRYDHTMIRFSNVGIGHFVIDSVAVVHDPGQPATFVAERLDDPISVPHPMSLNETGTPYERSVEIESWAEESPMYELQMMENGRQLVQPDLHEMDVELLGEPVTFAGYTAVAQSSQPVFPGYTLTAGKTYPFNFPVYRRWSLPYSLAPGESRTVQVMARPTQPVELGGTLVVSGYPLHDPNARQDAAVPLKVTGLRGPQVDYLPTVLRFPRGASAISTLNTVVVSHGDVELTRGDVSVVDDSNGLHAGDSQYFTIDSNTAPVATLPPGTSEFITVTYEPGCFHQLPTGGRHHALLRIETDAGVRQVALHGNPERWIATNPACQPGW